VESASLVDSECECPAATSLEHTAASSSSLLLLAASSMDCSRLSGMPADGSGMNWSLSLRIMDLEGESQPLATPLDVNAPSATLMLCVEGIIAAASIVFIFTESASDPACDVDVTLLLVGTKKFSKRRNSGLIHSGWNSL